MQSRFKRGALYAAILASQAVTIPQVFAQSSVVLEEIVVTARKRQESIQDVPIAMSAFSGDQMREAGITNVKDLALQVPGLQIDDQSTAQIWIRGIGQRDDSARLDSPVGVYIDGVYIARKDAQLLDMMDVESIQVLRGPQGTLFGKNTTGGAIVVNTRKPTESLGGYIEGRAGNYGRRDARAVLNLPLVDDKLYSKISLSSVKRDGYLENVLNGQEMNSEDRLAGSLQLRWLAADNVTVDTFLYYGKTREVQPGISCQWLNNSGYAGGDALLQSVAWPGDTQPVWSIDSQPMPPGFTDVSQTYKNDCDRSAALMDDDKVINNFQKAEYGLDNLMAGVTVEWEINDSLTFKSITGYGDQELSSFSGLGDNDATGGLYSGRDKTTPSKRDQFSQEFQLNGSALDDRFQYTAGLFGMVENIDDGETFQYRNVSALYLNPAVVPGDQMLLLAPTYQRDNYELKNTTYAAFFQGSYDLTENLQFTAGLRWTAEKRETELLQQTIDTGSFYNTINSAGIPGFNLINIGGQTLPLLASAVMPLNPLQTIQDLFPTDANGIPVYPLTTPTSYKDDETWEEISPMASISYTLPYAWLEDSFLDNAMTYFTYSEGFKSGTFEPFGSSGLRSVDPEVVTNYEIGAKLDGFDRTMRLNIAAYHMKYDDMQLRQVQVDNNNSPVVVLDNASKSEITGVELELTWTPVAGLLIAAGASFNDYDFVDFEDRQLSAEATASFAPNPTVDRSSEGFAEVPDKTYNLAVQYTWETSFGSITPRVDYSYVGEVFLGLDPGSWGVRDQASVDSYELVNARLGWVSPNRDWEVALYATNLTDEEYFQGAAAVGDSVGTFLLQKGAPRMYGVELLYRFGEY